jgi:hypothetical protein
MVEDRITDAKRIAQLLASELTGRQHGPLSSLAVVDADRDAEPSPDGTTAFAIEFEGERVGTVELFESRAVVAVTSDTDDLAAAADERGLAAERTDDGVTIEIDHGAAVKRAADALAAVLDETGDDVR